MAVAKKVVTKKNKKSNKPKKRPPLKLGDSASLPLTDILLSQPVLGQNVPGQGTDTFKMPIMAIGFRPTGGGPVVPIDPTNPLPVSDASGPGNTNITIANGDDVAEGSTTDVIVAAGAAGTVSAKLRRATQGLEDLKTLALTNAPAQSATGSIQTPLCVGANVGNASNNQTLSGAVNKTTYISGFYVTGLGASSASNIKVTITGLLGGATLTFDYTIPSGTTVQGTLLSMNFNPPIPANAQNTDIVVNVPAFGAGNTSASAGAFGFRQ